MECPGCVIITAYATRITGTRKDCFCESPLIFFLSFLCFFGLALKKKKLFLIMEVNVIKLEGRSLEFSPVERQRIEVIVKLLHY